MLQVDYSMKFLKKLIAWKPPLLKAGYKCFYAYYKFTQTCDLYMLLTSTLFSLATDYTATSYIYQSLGDVEWYIEMKLSSWQQWVKYRKSPRRSQCSENRSLESGTNRLATGEPFREKNKQTKNSCFLL